jgi:TfoX/Sxy family transcriptional regulator of competence genes
MAFDEQLCDRLRELLVELKQETVLEKYMFGGMCFMVNGNMCIGIAKNELMCRVGPKIQKKVCDLPGCRPMDFTGRPMKGYVFVDGGNLRKKQELKFWLQQCLQFNAELPPK